MGENETQATAIDLFGGLGWFSEGARQAGVRVAWAANHWPVAVATHAVNHPEAVHALEDVTRLDWTRVPRHDILLASPACQGHSRARGAERPHHDALRATAWAVVDAVEAHRPAAFVVENVPEFLDWELYMVWQAALERLGYNVERNVLNAADFGVPQSRERVFVIGTRRGPRVRIVPPGGEHVAAETIIDWTGPGWTPIAGRARPLAARTMLCIENGRKRHGARFLIPYYSGETCGRSIAKPLGTVMTRDRFAVVDGDRLRMLTVDELRRAMGFPERYRVPARRSDAVKALGNAVCPPVAREVIRQVLAAL